MTVYNTMIKAGHRLSSLILCLFLHVKYSLFVFKLFEYDSTPSLTPSLPSRIADSQLGLPRPK